MIEGTCDGHCGGAAPGGCYCDDSCHGNEDCCDDKVDFCGDKPASGSGMYNSTFAQSKAGWFCVQPRHF